MIKKVLFLLFFSFLFQCSENAPAQNTDINILHDLNKGGSTGRDNACKFLTQSVTPMNIAVPIGIFVWGAIKKDSITKRHSYVIAASLLSAALISTTLKYTVNRTRPFVTYSFIVKKTDAGSPSFPSGHTSAAFATASSLCFAYPKWYVIAPSFLWAASVGYSRMELGVHYPSDVLAGAMIGAGSSWLMWETNKWLSKKRKK